MTKKKESEKEEEERYLKSLFSKFTKGPMALEAHSKRVEAIISEIKKAEKEGKLPPLPKIIEAYDFAQKEKIFFYDTMDDAIKNSKESILRSVSEFMQGFSRHVNQYGLESTLNKMKRGKLLDWLGHNRFGELVAHGLIDFVDVHTKDIEERKKFLLKYVNERIPVKKVEARNNVMKSCLTRKRKKESKK
jgi:hypothetical protein